MNTDLRLFLSSAALGFAACFGGAYLLVETLLSTEAPAALRSDLDADLALVMPLPAANSPANAPLVVSLPLAAESVNWSATIPSAPGIIAKVDDVPARFSRHHVSETLAHSATRHAALAVDSPW